MALPSNDDFANCELSTEELEAIAAGWSFGGIIHSIEHGLKSLVTNPYFEKAGLAFVIIGGLITAGGGGGSSTRNQQF